MPGFPSVCLSEFEEPADAYFAGLTSYYEITTKTTTSVTSHTILQTSTSSFTPLSIPVRSYWVVVLSSPSNTKKQSVANINITREKSSPETPASICHSILKTTSAEISASTTCKRFTYTLSHGIPLYAKDTAQSRQQMRFVSLGRFRVLRSNREGS
ncbi:hypothetical protein M438DRAFT_344536 [Aureobasidium pullulans EXF-150]|uniref:Uncharacterized protein n=1 Tax=Aureobasidium pullulans EXF-150 TaxID=1043002 RepID=A0A074YH36_AURPU|nr:uncharacterized protein M438DRAFT_344536 [Aureobasidium pullulans EXF-150]KEQ86146.1 hypothetical protein M438DRAFT_344536 [Aureobasidium pullulans EXF-150]